MSAEAVGWVFRESPYRGAMFALHLAIADTVNDTYGNELWASVAHLAGKARLGERSVRSGLAEMVNDGCLELVSARDGHVRRYRFLMPDNPCTSCTPAPAAPLHVATKTPARRAQTPAPRAETPARRAPISQVTQLNPSREPNSLAADLAAGRNHKPADLFDEFWSVYPKRVAKGAARTAWKTAAKKEDPHVLIAAAASYRDDPNRDPKFTKHPATWLNGECWNDEPDTERRHAKGVTAAQRFLDRQTGVIDYPEPPEVIER